MTSLADAPSGRSMVTELLDFAIEAHGGIGRWNDFNRLTADLSIGGYILEMKQASGLLDDVTSELNIREERLTLSRFARSRSMTTFVPGRITVQQDDGMVESCYNPRSTFEGQAVSSKWDEFHVAYFSSYALWTYLTSPFLFTYPGFVTEELEPWLEDGEEWRRLKVTFPDYIDSHTREQISYFGPDGLVRRHDYEIDLLGGTRSANYAFDYREVQGIKMPTARQVFSFDDAGNKISDRMLMKIDIGSIEFS